MTMKTWSMALVISGALGVAGCGVSDETPPPTEMTVMEFERGESTSALNQAGEPCRAICNLPRTPQLLVYCNYGITHDCRDWAVKLCRGKGLWFYDAAWTWGHCG
ncbi:MAG: hypothetical protein IPJ65_22050 [Archangiaceae bacterium]|nr:hypothetical protein [Archangiaceae bacterium]